MSTKKILAGLFLAAMGVGQPGMSKPASARASPQVYSARFSASARTENTIAQKATRQYTRDDLFYLAAILCREFGGDDNDELLFLCAGVVLNRVRHPSFPSTIYGVITQKGQYQGIEKSVQFPGWATKAQKDRCYRIARQALCGERRIPGSVIFQAEFRQGSGVYRKVGKNYFCYA